VEMIHDFILSSKFWKNVKLMVEVLKPIFNFICMIDSSMRTMGKCINYLQTSVACHNFHKRISK